MLNPSDVYINRWKQGQVCLQAKIGQEAELECTCALTFPYESIRHVPLGSAHNTGNQGMDNHAGQSITSTLFPQMVSMEVYAAERGRPWGSPGC